MTTKTHPYQDFYQQLEPALTHKAEEICLIGYASVTINDLWTFLISKKWKKPNEHIRIYELFNDIMSLKIGDYMNYATVEAFRTSDWQADLESVEIKALIHQEPKKNKNKKQHK